MSRGSLGTDCGEDNQEVNFKAIFGLSLLLHRTHSVISLVSACGSLGISVHVRLLLSFSLVVRGPCVTLFFNIDHKHMPFVVTIAASLCDPTKALILW